MFQTQTRPAQTSTSLLEIERLVRELSAERFNVDERGLALIVDAVQRYKDFLGELELADFSEAPVIVRTEGQTVKFTDIDKLANWLSEHME